jgi:hypothetical protein
MADVGWMAIARAVGRKRVKRFEGKVICTCGTWRTVSLSCSASCGGATCAALLQSSNPNVSKAASACVWEHRNDNAC